MPRKCFLIFICILMCPRKSYPQDTENSIENNVHESKEAEQNFDGDKDNDPGHQNQEPSSQWVGDDIDMQNDEPLLSRPDEAEAGFDLTPEEKAKFKIWPDGIIPYYIDNFSFDKGFRKMLSGFLRKWSGLTGLRFSPLPRALESDTFRYVFFLNRRGVLECQDYTTVNFTNQGVQRVVIGYDCFSDGEGPGSLILALAGVPPMHRAPDRDKYIKVSTKNALPGTAHLFDIISDRDWLFHDISYDWFSAGHYTWHKYTTNGHATIAPKKKMKAPLTTGEYKRLSFKDAWKIQMLYNFKPNKNQQPMQQSQCAKLFRPGSNFNSYTAKSGHVKARKKPNKYLGISNEVQENPDVNEVQENRDVDEVEEKRDVDEVEEERDVDEVQEKHDVDEVEEERDVDEVQEKRDVEKVDTSETINKLLDVPLQTFSSEFATTMKFDY